MKLLFKMKNGGKEELTMDEARELYNELHQIFGANSAPSPWPHVNPVDPFNTIGVPKGHDFYGPIQSALQWPAK